MRAFVDDRFQVVASPLILAELELVLRRPKLAAYVDERVAREFVERVRRHATIVDDPVERPAVTRDRKDDYLVALARGERVDAIVSGGRDIADPDSQIRPCGRHGSRRTALVGPNPGARPGIRPVAP